MMESGLSTLLSQSSVGDALPLKHLLTASKPSLQVVKLERRQDSATSMRAFRSQRASGIANHARMRNDGCRDYQQPARQAQRGGRGSYVTRSPTRADGADQCVFSLDRLFSGPKENSMESGASCVV